MVIPFTDHTGWRVALHIAKAHGYLGDMIICATHLWIRGKLALALKALGY